MGERKSCKFCQRSCKFSAGSCKESRISLNEKREISAAASSSSKCNRRGSRLAKICAIWKRDGAARVRASDESPQY